MNRYTEPTSYAFAWHCTEPPPLVEFDFPAGESPGDYKTIIDYIQHFAKNVPSGELIQAVAGGKEAVLDSLLVGRAIYDDGLAIENDWKVNWHKSHYPDGTPVYFFTQTGIEHVFEPVGYKRSSVE